MRVHSIKRQDNVQLPPTLALLFNIVCMYIQTVSTPAIRGMHRASISHIIVHAPGKKIEHRVGCIRN